MLPPSGSVATFARLLGVHWITLYRWAEQANAEAKTADARVASKELVNERHRWTIHRDALVAWLVKKGHYTPKGVYE